jgi:carbamoyltransferase
MNILGISAYYHDSAAALIRDGRIVNAAQEERFTRKKHDPGFPSRSIRFCLDADGLQMQDLHQIVFYDKPLTKFERLLETYLACAPSGIRSFLAAMPVWLKEKLYLKALLKKELAALGGMKERQLPPLLFGEHHESHAASAFYPSPFQRAGILCMDGVGEWATTSVWLGEDNRVVPQWEIEFPHSLGLLYSAFTYYTGFRVNSGEYKLMGLAPYGEPKYESLIREHLIDIKPDGTFRLDMRYFDYATGLRMTNDRFSELLGGPPRQPDHQVTQKEMDIASSIQRVTEEVVLRLGRAVQQELKVDALCLAGGVALNCVANGRLLREGPFRHWRLGTSWPSNPGPPAALTRWPAHTSARASAIIKCAPAWTASARGIANWMTLNCFRNWRAFSARETCWDGSRGAWSSDPAPWADGPFWVTPAVLKCSRYSTSRSSTVSRFGLSLRRCLPTRCHNISISTGPVPIC